MTVLTHNHKNIYAYRSIYIHIYIIWIKIHIKTHIRICIYSGTCLLAATVPKHLIPKDRMQRNSYSYTVVGHGYGMALRQAIQSLKLV